MRRISIALVAILLGGCATSVAHFWPTEELARQRNRPLSARYELAGPDGGKVGEAWVWSRGIFKEGDRAVAHVGIELESDSTEGLSVDVGSLRLVAREGKKDKGKVYRPLRTDGKSSAPPRGYSRLDAYFRLPEGVKPRAITSFDVLWKAKAGEADTGEVTPFVRAGSSPRVAGAMFHGPYIPGTSIYSPVGAWFSCPGEDTYYTEPPDCDEE